MHTKTHRCTEYLTALDKIMEKHHSVIQVKPAYLNCSSCYRLSTTLLDTSVYDDYMHESWFNVHVTHHPCDPSKWNIPVWPMQWKYDASYCCSYVASVNININSTSNEAYRYCSSHLKCGDSWCSNVQSSPFHFRCICTYRYQIKNVMAGSINDLTKSLNSSRNSVIHQHIHCLHYAALHSV